MAHRCALSGTGPQFGHRVSHAKNRRKRTFEPNLQSKSIYIPELKRTVRLKLSTRMIRTIDKLGFNATLQKLGLRLKDLVPTAAKKG